MEHSSEEQYKLSSEEEKEIISSLKVDQSMIEKTKKRLARVAKQFEDEEERKMFGFNQEVFTYLA